MLLAGVQLLISKRLYLEVTVKLSIMVSAALTAENAAGRGWLRTLRNGKVKVPRADARIGGETLRYERLS